jgi:preprotein translocase subunit SecY
MKRFFTTISNIFKIEELRDRIITTLVFLVVFRLGSFVVLPGVNPAKITDDPSGTADSAAAGLIGLIDIISGGAFNNVSVFGLGIMPYITASIVIQLLTFAVPAFQKMSKEGESGRRKINQMTRLLTIVVTLAQSLGYLAVSINNEMLFESMNGPYWNIIRIITLISGTMFCMWMGERITEKGIGNGISMLIMIGIISRFPESILAEMDQRGLRGGMYFVIEMLIFFAIIMVVVAVTQATRRIEVQYARQIAGGRTVTGQRSYIPMKLISANVMPIVFAQSVMFLPGMVLQVFQDQAWASSISLAFSDFTTWQYNVLLATLIILFTFFYTAIIINPKNMADDLKRNGGFIPGVKPGEATAEHIDVVLSRLTLPGALILALIAVLPAFAFLTVVKNPNFAYFFGGTSLLIMIGVVLDTLQQIESYLLMRHYDGMMKSGRIKGRAQTAPVAG